MRANHRAWKFHSEKEISDALEKHKRDGTYLAADDVAEFLDEYLGDLPGVMDDETEQVLDTAMMAEEIADVNSDLEEALANMAFVHSCGFFLDRARQMKKEFNSAKCLAIEQNLQRGLD